MIKHRLTRNYNPQLKWYCISCNEKVNQEESDHFKKSYFISVDPNNARICVDCMAKTIIEGSY